MDKDDEGGRVSGIEQYRAWVQSTRDVAGES